MTKKNLERFLREARAAAKLEHPNIVQVLNVDKSPEGLYFIIMQFIDGQNIDQLIKENGAFQWREATRIIAEASAGLRLAHNKGIIHRDIKAENIMLDRKGTTKLADFGLAKDENTNVNITKDGAFIGTLLYMAPEIGRLNDVDGRVDIYSLGITYYYMLTGIQPFQRCKTIELLTKRAHKKIKAPEKYVTGIPRDVRRVLGKMLATNRDKRYLTMDDVITDLKAIMAELPVKAGGSAPWGKEDFGAASAISTEDQGSKAQSIIIILGVIILAFLGIMAFLMRP
jgi:serine/threonine-protein kinase